MSKTPTAFVLEVVEGSDRGARLEVGATARTIGRARTADLVLKDLGVSRHHLQVTATENGVQLEVSPGAAAFLLGGKPLRSAEARVGESILVGSTLLEVTIRASDSSLRVPLSPSVAADVGTVLTGVGANARAMAAVHALIEALDPATDAGSLASALSAWCREQTPACTVEIASATGAGSGGEVVELVRGAATVIVVPAPSDDPASLEFVVPAPGEVSDPFRRMLVLAGRLYGSALARVRRTEVADGEVAALRVLSFGTSHEFLGTSPAAQQLSARIPRVAGSDVHVLIEGETGVGKTFVARLIHEASPRAREPLRVINCASIPETLLESELFGHERGAFTGAVTQRVGALEAAGRGTLFLDEIGELSLANQAKLLRAVEEKRFERVGSNKTLQLRARVLSATNRDLAALVAEGRFRSDLLFRLSVVKLPIPPLRERGDDLVLLAEQILRDTSREAHRRLDGFSADALDAIRRYAWPGNVRELRNAIEHAIVMGDGRSIERSDLPEALAAVAPPSVKRGREGSPDTVTLPANLAWLQARAIEAALRVAKNNRTRAAALLGIPRSTLYEKLATLPPPAPAEDD